ncbi:FG-GAP-like repeat-containing protein [Larkinella terrae]|uniref:Dystroglycan-type cadherin-like domain-containing protein n=1 Tax=Larkinella terrae TaxID=2025311 RepID=A0A7K0ELC0_9BACT|nr:FG-GAP-like repeat-containing protein [Larkinella terrae]MRS62248.1 hypothetical protein [Larkinella terrae]
MKKLYHIFTLLGLLAASPSFSQCFLPYFTTAAGNGPNSVVVGDFNKDDKPDLATSNRIGNNISVLLRQEDGTFGSPTYYAVGNFPDAITSGDFDGDGQIDLATANTNSNTVSVLLGNGNGTFKDAVNNPVGTFPESIVAGFFNNDGNLDLAIANIGTDNVSVLLGNGDGTFGLATNYPVGDEPHDIAVGDFDGDNDADLVTADSRSNQVSVLLNNGDGTFATAAPYDLRAAGVTNDVYVYRVAIGNFNGDTKPDLAVILSPGGKLSILLNKGDGTFNTAMNYTLTSGIADAAVVDFNDDGKDDLLILDSSFDNLLALPGQGDGTFGEAKIFDVGLNVDPVALAVSDLNGDGKPDVVTANRTAGNVSVLLACPTPTLTGFSASPNPVCPGQTATFTATVGNPSDSYSYTLSNGVGSPLSGTATTAAFSQTLTSSGTGVQSYTLTVTTGGGTATSSVSLTVNTSTAPTITANVPAGSPGTVSVLQNTPFVSLMASGCSGTVAWSGAGSGSGTSLSVPTSVTGTLVYSASCTAGSCVSPPATFTVVVTPPTATGSFDGFVYGADCSTFRGWAWDRNKPNSAVSVEILDGPNVIGMLLADVFRQDLQTAGKGNGKHAFFFPIPESLKDGLSHNLSARIKDSGFILKDSPKALICVGTGTPENKPPVPPSPTVLIAPLAAQVNVPFSGTLVAFTDPEGQPLTYALSGLPNGLSINPNTRIISGTPVESGTFTLAYSANDGVLTNSVSFPLTVNPASTTTVTGSFEGYLDKVECGTIRGWVWDRNKPNTPVTVEFYTDGMVWGSTVANIYRDDLKNAGKGNGAHAYSFTVPNALKDGTTRIIYGRVLGSTYALKDSGKPLTCSSPAPVRLSADTGSDLQVTVLGNPVVGSQLAVEVRGAAGQPLQLRLMNAAGNFVQALQVKTAQAVEQQTISVQDQPAGILILQVSTPAQNRTLKILKR